MDSIYFIAFLVLLALSAVINLALSLYIRRNSEQIKRGFMEFITPEKPGVNSGLDDFVQGLSTNIGHAVFNQVRSMVATDRSAEVRGKKAVDGAITTDLLGATNPMLAGLLESMPALKKVVTKNPTLAQYAIDRMMQSAQAAQPGQSPNNGNNGYQGTTVDIL